MILPISCRTLLSFSTAARSSASDPTPTIVLHKLRYVGSGFLKRTRPGSGFADQVADDAGHFFQSLVGERTVGVLHHSIPKPHEVIVQHQDPRLHAAPARAAGLAQQEPHEAVVLLQGLTQGFEGKIARV